MPNPVLYSKPQTRIFKPVQKYPKGAHEVSLYRHLWRPDCIDPVLLQLRNFMPRFCGVFQDLRTSGQGLHTSVCVCVCTRPFVLSFGPPDQYHPSTVCLLLSDLFIGMDDVLAGLQRPCVCDIKMGRSTFTPDASREKRAVEQAKYVWQAELGFCITGMRVSCEVIPMWTQFTLYSRERFTMVVASGMQYLFG